MHPFLIHLIGFVYFFCAGILFRDMLDEVKTGPSSWWPITGALLLSVFWVVLVLWAVVNLFCRKTRWWYYKFAITIFEDEKPYTESPWGSGKF